MDVTDDRPLKRRNSAIGQRSDNLAAHCAQIGARPDWSGPRFRSNGSAGSAMALCTSRGTRRENPRHDGAGRLHRCASADGGCHLSARPIGRIQERASLLANSCRRPPGRSLSMANKMLIDATHPEETRVVVLRGNRVHEFDFESASRKQLRGNIYLARGDPGRTVAPGGVRRLRRQPPRLPRLQRNPPRLLPDPGRRPAGADRGRAPRGGEFRG